MPTIDEILNEFGESTIDIIRTNLVSTGTNATGETSQSLRNERPAPNKVKVTGKDFIYVVETGRKPGGMPPISNILKWLNTGKVSVQGSIESAAFAIAKKIGEKGSKLFREGGREDIITPAVSDERVDVLTDQIADATLGITVNKIDDAIRE